MPARWRGGPTEPKSGTAPPHPLPGPGPAVAESWRACVSAAGWKGRSPFKPDPLLDDEHVAAHGACQVVGRATPNMLVDPGMSREADYQQIDGILLDEIANYLDGVSGRNHRLDVHGIDRRARPALLGKLPEVAIGAILLFA